MSVNPPPSPNVNRFNNLYWISAESGLTIGVADTRYLKFPTAQGTENLSTTNVNGVLTSNNSTIQADTTNIVSSRFQQSNLNLKIEAGYNKPSTSMTFYVNNSSATQVQAMNYTYTAITTGGQQFNFNSALAPLSSQTIPAFENVSNQMPTTNWIQSVVALKGGLQEALIYKDKDYDYNLIDTKAQPNIFSSAPTTNCFYGSANNSVMGLGTANGADIYLYNPVGSGLGASYSFSSLSYTPYTIVFSADGNAGLLTNDGGGINSSDVWRWDGKNIVTTGAPNQYWYDAAMSANGKYAILAEISGGSQCYISSDYGNNWSAAGAFGVFFAVAVSATGKYMMSVSQFSAVYTSSNYGVSWTTSLSNSISWFGCCMSANGQYMIAIANDSGNPSRLYTSNDFGANWINQGIDKPWLTCCMTDDGRFQVAWNGYGEIWYSLNFGQTWTQGASGVNFNTQYGKPHFTNDGRYIVGLNGSNPTYIQFSDLW